MALTHAMAIRTEVADLVVDKLDEGSEAATGSLVLLTEEEVAAATILLGDPAFGDAVDGVATANSVTEDSAAIGGVATHFELRNKDGDVIISGTFGTTGADLIGTNATIAENDVVDINDGDLEYEAMP